MAGSIGQHKVEAHLKTMRMVHRLLPVSKIMLEVAQFDLQRIRTPDIEEGLPGRATIGLLECQGIRAVARPPHLPVVLWHVKDPHLERPSDVWIHHEAYSHHP